MVSMILNNKGFSLVSVMVAAGLLGGLSLAVMELMKNMGNVQTFSQSSMDYLDLSREITFILSSPNDCAASFQGVTFRGSTIQGTPVDIELWNSDQDGNRSRMRFTGNSSDPKSKFGKMKIKSISFSMPDYTGGDFSVGSGQSFKGTLEVTGEKKISSNKMRDTRPISRTLRVFFDTDSSGESSVTGCTSLSQVSDEYDVELNSCSWSGYVNTWDALVDYTCPDNEVMAGVRSTHNNGTEDRRYSFNCCRATANGTDLVKSFSVFSGDVNSKDQLVNYTCPTPLVYTGVKSSHDNGSEDRAFSFQCSSMILNEFTKLKDCEISSYVNNMDANVDYTCPLDKILVGEMSYHNNGTEDRRFRYKCCSLIAR